MKPVAKQDLYQDRASISFFPKKGSLPTNIYEWRRDEIFGRDKKNTFVIFTIFNFIINIKKHNKICTL